MLPPRRLVTEYRTSLRDVNTLAHADLLRAWRQLDLTDAIATRNGLLDLLPGIVNSHHLNAATAAADFYDVARSDLGVKGRFSAVMADDPDPTASQALARWGVGPMFSADPSSAVALSKIAGGMQRLIADGARSTVVGSTAKDPNRARWARETDGNSCDFCQMLADRGAVYARESGDFAAHDACGCVAVPDF